MSQHDMLNPLARNVEENFQNYSGELLIKRLVQFMCNKICFKGNIFDFIIPIY